MKRKPLLFILLGSVVIIAGGFLYLRTSLFLRHLGYLLEYKYGYVVHADNVIFSPALKAEISGFQIAKPADDGFQFASSRIDVESKPFAAIKGEVEKIVLKEPKIQVRLGQKKETETDLSFIRKIPPVQLLIVQKGECKLLFSSAPYEVVFKEIDLNVKDFSPRKGGNITFQGSVDVIGKEPASVIAHGRCKGRMSLTGLLPSPVGTGILEISLASGTMEGASFEKGTLYFALNFDRERVSVSSIDVALDSILLDSKKGKTAINKVTLTAGMTYDLKPKLLTLDRLQWEAPSFGLFKGSGRGTMKDDFPWRASIEASGIDFATLLALVGPLLEKPGNEKWSIQGKGSMKAEMEGTMAEKGPTLAGRATLQFEKGGFASADGTKAGQGIEGTMILKFTLPTGDKKVNLNLRSEISSGEYLFGTYYKDLTKGQAKISSDLDLFLGEDHHLDFKGNLNLSDTGEYLFGGFIDKNRWGVSFTGKDISPNKLASLFLYDFLQQKYQFLKDMKIAGTLNTHIKAEGEGEQYTLDGHADIDGLSIEIPGKSLHVSNVSIRLPFDLHHPSAKPPEKKSSSGSIYIGRIETGALKFAGMTIPIIVSGNNIVLPANLEIPFYGGTIRILQCNASNILSPLRKFHFAAEIENVNTGALLHALTGVELPGKIEARFPHVSYQDNKWATRGVTSLKVFGGVIEARNVHAKNLFAASRTVGGDIAFHDIDLGQITDTIKIGKIKGVITGSIKDLEIEYGQPSRFFLDIDSGKKKGVEQKISVDAIENISILGTGSSGVGLILKSGVNRFFKEYPYSRIGVTCTLENDKFRVNGKIHEGGAEYFIRRGLIRGIDVVNRDPHNTISFKDMAERVSRIFKGQAQGSFTTGMN